METYIAEWLHLGLRWLHLVTAITWVGSSFYFNRIDRSFRPPEPPIDRVSGQLWSIHGGSIYNYRRYPLGPGFIPGQLKWSKWESLSTWVSGALLLAVLYWWGASINLVSASAGAITPGIAILISIGSIIASWFIYDTLCRLITNERVLIMVLAVVFGASVWLFSQVFSGKAAYLHTGIAMGTIMAGNVWFIILPGQRRMLKAIQDGTIDKFEVGADAKRRNYHANYLTLPVLFAMISAHFPITYGSEYGWLAFILISASGVAIRHFFNTMHAGRPQPAYIGLGALFILITVWLIAPAGLLDKRDAAAVDVAQVQTVIHERCTVCHSARPTFDGFDEAPKGTMFDTMAEISAKAPLIQQQVVMTDVMPPGNLTEMTDDERALIADWIAQGAPAE